MITSSKKAEDEKLNVLDTGTFNYQDISNEAWYKAQQISGGVDVGNTSGVSVAPPIPLQSSDKVSNLTKSTVSKGNIIIRDEAGQQSLTGKTSQETISSVNRESEKAHKPLEVIFDEEKIRAEFEIVKGFSKEMGTFIENKMKSAKAYEKELEERLKNGESKQSPEVKDLINKIEDLNKWAPGGIYRQVSTALTAALSGNVGGANNLLIQSFAANYLQSLGAEQIKEIAKHIGGEGSPGHIALHALLGCAAGSVTNTCTEAAMGAAAGVVVNSLLDDPAELDPIQREQRKNLVTSIVAAIATGVGSDHVAAITNSTQIESENNAIIVPIFVFADKVVTVKEMHDDIKSVINGEKTWEELAKEKSIEYMVSLIAGSAGKYIWKHVKNTPLGSKFEEKVQEGSLYIAKKLDANDEKIKLAYQKVTDPFSLKQKKITKNPKETDIIAKNNTPTEIPKQDKKIDNSEKKVLGTISNDFEDILKGNKKLSEIEKEKGSEYIIELSKEARNKGFTLEKRANGDWGIFEKNEKTGKNVPVQIHAKNNIDAPFKSTEESNYIKKITEGKMTWEELEKVKGKEYVENIVRGKDSAEIWTNAIKNPDLTIQLNDKKKYNNDKELIVLRKWDEAKERLDKNKPISTVKSENLGTQKPYSPLDVREELIDHHGAGNVKSTTVPPLNMPNVKLAGKEKVIEVQRTREVFDHKTNKMVTESVTEKVTIVFDKRGFPIFDDVAKVEIRLPINEQYWKLKPEQQMAVATKNLKTMIKNGEISKSQFTLQQLEAINNGQKTINGFIWHHHQETGRMQLIPDKIHEAVKHAGWTSMSKGQ